MNQVQRPVLVLDLAPAPGPLGSRRLGLGDQEAGPIRRSGHAPTRNRFEGGLVVRVRSGQLGVESTPGVGDQGPFPSDCAVLQLLVRPGDGL